MLSFPNAKINLGLRITGRLPGGYHRIESCLFPIPWQDALEFVPEKKTIFESSGLPVEGKPEQNLVLKAYRLLKKEYPVTELSIHLHKTIPMGAGLGGGSADAAFMLKMLNEYFRLSLDDSLLEDYAAKLGSDSPFFIQNTPALARGTGTDLQALDLDLSGLHLVILNPGIHISTREAYGGVAPKPSDQNLEALLLSKDFEKWRKVLVNDFEKSIFERYPLLSDLKSQLYKMGAVYAAMSGSGSALFGLFKSDVKIPKDLENYVCFKSVISKPVVSNQLIRESVISGQPRRSHTAPKESFGQGIPLGGTPPHAKGIPFPKGSLRGGEGMPLALEDAFPRESFGLA